MGKSIVFTEEQKDFMVYNYTVLKKGVNAIGRDLGVSGITVKRHLKKMGVKIRNLQESMQECRAYNVNDNYFKTQSHNMAYILGFIASDGCISKDTNHIIFDIQECDEEILYKIKEELEYEGPIRHYTNNSGCKYSRLKICSSIIKRDLEYYGITPKKTFTLRPPLFLDEKYYISYIRGYFDGDGCIYINHQKYKYNWYICGARKEVIEWIMEILLNKYGIISRLHSSTKVLSHGDPFYSAQIYKKDTIQNLFKILYVPNSLYLERKYLAMKNFYDIKSTRLYSLSDKEKRYAELIQIQE